MTYLPLWQYARMTATECEGVSEHVREKGSIWSKSWNQACKVNAFYDLLKIFKTDFWTNSIFLIQGLQLSIKISIYVVLCRIMVIRLRLI